MDTPNKVEERNVRMLSFVPFLMPLCAPRGRSIGKVVGHASPFPADARIEENYDDNAAPTPQLIAFMTMNFPSSQQQRAELNREEDNFHLLSQFAIFVSICFVFTLAKSFSAMLNDVECGGRRSWKDGPAPSNHFIV